MEDGVGVEYVGLRKSCTLCTQHHVACDGRHPCQRCIEWNNSAQCHFLLSRKRGRPQKRTDNAPAPGGVASNKRHRPPAPPPPATAALQAGGLQRSPPKAVQRKVAPAGHHLQQLLAQSQRTARQTTATQPTRSVDRAQSGSVVAGQQGAVGFPSMAIMSLLVEQVRGLRDENRLLLDRVSSLQNQQTVFEQQMDAFREESRASSWLLDQLAQRHESVALRTRLPQDLYSQPIEPSHRARVSAVTHVLPFLRGHDLSTLIIDDLQKPFAAFTVETTSRGEVLPLFKYLSPGYCELFGYAQDELLGNIATTTCHPHDSVTRQIVLCYLREVPYQSLVGPIFSTSPMGLSKDRRVLRLQARHQYFFNESGRAEWGIIVVDRVLSSGHDSPRYTGPPDTRVMVAPWAYEDEEGVKCDSSPGLMDPGKAVPNDQRIDRELDELLHCLSATSPCTQ